MYEKYKGAGLQILAFPCNQFANQEPDSNDQIFQRMAVENKLSFPIFAKIEVNGPNTHPVYQFLRQNSELWNAKK